MPTPDDHEPSARGPRRPLGRGPGAVPLRADAADEAPPPEDTPSQGTDGAAPRLDGPPSPGSTDDAGTWQGHPDGEDAPADAAASAVGGSDTSGSEAPAPGVPHDPPAADHGSAGAPAGVGGPIGPGEGGERGGPAESGVPDGTGPVAEPGDAPAVRRPSSARADDRPDTGAASPAHPSGAEDAAAGESAAAGGAAAAEAAADTVAVDLDATAEAEDDGRFTVRLDNFEGPFDLLLQLISKHKLDVTEVALSKVTDEFMAHIRAMGPDWDLDQTTEFLVVAATLLDLKAARLLPAAEVEDEADLALLEARDLLFARLLQYRAYKRVADIFADRLAVEARRHPRTVGLEPHHAELLPEVALSIGPEGFARLAVKAMQPKPKPQVYVEHIHAPLVSVREQAEVVVARLRELGETGFRELIADAPDTLTVVARFLALLELYRERAVTLDQPEALGDLTVRWTGGEQTTGPLVTDEFDQDPQPADQPEKEPQP